MFPTDAKLINRAREKLVRLAKKLRRRSAPVLCAGRQAGADQASALCPCQAVQARQQGAAQAQDLSRAHHPRHRQTDRRRRRASGDLRQAAASGRPGARAEPPPARAQGLQPPCSGSRMHRQGQGARALRVRRQGQRRHHAQALQGRPVRAHAKALPGNPYDGHTLATSSQRWKRLIGTDDRALLADAGYQGHNAPPDHKFKVYTAGQKRRMTPPSSAR